MLRTLTPLAIAAVLTFAGPAAQAAEVLVAGTAANPADGLNGEPSSSSNGSGATVATFGGGGFVGYTITTIKWWGFDFELPPDNAFDAFVNATPLLTNAAAGIAGFTLISGTTPGGTAYTDVPLYEYVLDVSGVGLTVGTSNSLSLENTSLDAEWYWQYAAGSNSTLAFQIFAEAPVVGVPEPGSLLLVALAGLALVATRRRA